MFNRKEAKAQARRAVGRHYGLFLVTCMIAAFFHIGYNGSLSLVTMKNPFAGERDIRHYTVLSLAPAEVWRALAEGDVDRGQQTADALREEITAPDANRIAAAVFGHSNGVFSKIVNDVFSGSVFLGVYMGVRRVAGSDSIAKILFILISLMALLLIWFFFLNVYKAVAARIFLEGSVYEAVFLQRFVYFWHIKRWTRACATMALTAIFQGLWSLTVIGGVIKRYAYYMVPYIVAENPDIGCCEAITLSRNMMYGHKWECFLMELSFIGWDFLATATLGLSGLFYSSMYEEATGAAYYRYVRQAAKNQEIAGTVWLCDTYLFEKPTQLVLNSAYEDVLELLAQPDEEVPKLKGVRAFFADVFGVTLSYTKGDEGYRKNMEKKTKISHLQSTIDGQSYPNRLSPFQPADRRAGIEYLHYLRRYSVSSLILQFFVFSFIGWAWEVCLYLVMTGEFVNRGVLYGPWLPIYGTGGIAILLVLNRFRQKPVLQFLSAVILCGVLEYFTGYFLELTHNGRKWWDYTGYFLNLHGRICAEGLLVFGLGGLAIVYLLAPLLDNQIRRLSGKFLILLCAVLIAAFVGDWLYSTKKPNMEGMSQGGAREAGRYLTTKEHISAPPLKMS